MSYKIFHLVLTWGIGLFTLAVGFLRMHLSAAPMLALVPGAAIVLLGEYLRYQYLRERSE